MFWQRLVRPRYELLEDHYHHLSMNQRDLEQNDVSPYAETGSDDRSWQERHNQSVRDQRQVGTDWYRRTR